MQSKDSIRSCKMLGFSYMIIACMFCALVIITIPFMPTNELFSINFIKNIKQFKFVGIFVISNIFISLTIGLILLLIYKFNKLVVRWFVLALAFLLVILDTIPIIDMLNNINAESNNTPWTIILLFIHLFLFVSIIKQLKGPEGT